MKLLIVPVALTSLLLSCSEQTAYPTEESTMLEESKIRETYQKSLENPILTYENKDIFYTFRAFRISAQLESAMRSGRTLKADCPAKVEDLRYIQVSHLNFMGKVEMGEVIVHKTIVEKTMNIFEELMASLFAIDKMKLMLHYNGDDEAAMLDNNSSAFNTRPIHGSQSCLSKHSYGIAIDLNPRQNPYIKPLPDVLEQMGQSSGESSQAFLVEQGFDSKKPILDFCAQHPEKCDIAPTRHSPFYKVKDEQGRVTAEVVQVFKRNGFAWGGEWENTVDLHHFEATLPVVK